MKFKLLFFLPLFLFFYGCANDNINETQAEETINIKDVTSEVLLFEFTNDVQNNSYRLNYEIKYTNPNNFAIKGFPSVTADYNGLILTPFQVGQQLTPIEIAAKSTYTEIYNVIKQHDTQALSPEQIKNYYIKFVSTKFNIVSE